MRDDDLSLLGVSPSDRRRLEAMGITTLEQIVVSGDRHDVGAYVPGKPAFCITLIVI